jgi:hypothetical protein
LAEALGEAGITFRDGDHLVGVLDELDTEQLERASAASRALQPRLSWPHIASAFLDAVVDVGAIKA